MLKTRSRALMMAASSPTGRLPGALSLIGQETDAVAIDFTDMSISVRDVTTPANNFVGVPSSKLTYTSPSTKWILGADGLYASGTTIRTEYDTAGVPLGVRREEARTNVVLWNRDLTNAAWVKTSCTAAKNQTGIDGAANSASSLTASGANATCLQAITLASSARYQSAFIKRITGSGTIQMTLDNGTTWTTVTVTSSWRPLEVPTQTLANPTVGFKIVTSGDAIAVDMVQNENGAFRTSPIATTTVAVTRNADRITMTSFTWNANTGTLFTKGRLFSTAAYIGTGTMIAQVSQTAISGFAGVMLFTDSSGRYNFRVRQDSGTSTIFSTSGISSGLSPTSYDKLAVAFATGNSAAYQNGAQTGTSVSAHGTTTLQMLAIGSSPAGGFESNGHIAQVLYVNRRMLNAELVTLTT